jgi:hypothetical protein
MTTQQRVIMGITTTVCVTVSTLLAVLTGLSLVS